jgi:hypothetical protein
VCFDRTDKQYADDYKRVRLQIAEVLDVDEYEELSVILTTSGTDAELLALYFSLCASERAVMNILVGPEETGSGVVSAATGLHFASHTPFGKTVKKGYPIEEMPTERIRIGEVPLRDEEGIEFTKEKIDGRLKILVGKAIADGCHVLIHLVNSSKTGLTAPSLETVVSLKKRHGSSVDIVVDACQSRIGKNKLRKYIAEGFMVIITGSKFYTGPPFSGALLVPSPISQRVNNSKRCLPAGFKNYFSYHEFPEGWQVGRNHLSRMKNVGLLLRWQAALWEMQTFRAVSEKQKYLIFMLFGESIRQAINSNPDLRLVDSAVNERWRLPDRAEWDWLPTIFTFMMIGSISEGRRKPLFISETKKIYHWLNDSISHLLPSEASDVERQLAGRRFHIGQPIKLSRIDGEWIGALRISAGARLVSGVNFDAELGRHFAERLSREIGDACAALDKISLIIKYMNYIVKVQDTFQREIDQERPYLT